MSDFTFETTLATDDPLFAGHFPDVPLYPAIGQLALIEAALSRWQQSPCALAAAPNLKFLRPLRPGEQVEVRLDSVGAAEVAVEIRVAGSCALRGRIHYCRAEAA